MPTPFCVVFFAGSTYYTRGCMDDLLKSARHRLDLPTVRRHGYCVNARNYERMLQASAGAAGTDQYFYCFCNDWNGCNDARPHAPLAALTLLLAASTAVAVVGWLRVGRGAF